MKEKRVVFLGDSITEGAGASEPDKCYVSLIGKMPDFEYVYNAGIGGTRVSRNFEPSQTHRHNADFNLRVCLLPTPADYVVVFGGVNDWGRSDVPLGNVGDKTVYSFAGAIEVLIEQLSEKYGRENIRFILPMKCYNCRSISPVNGYMLKDYVSKEKEVLDYYKIPYLNLFDFGPEEPLVNTNTGLFFDGLHPNDEGHKYLAEKISNFIRETENK